MIDPSRFFQPDDPNEKNGIATDDIYSFNRDHASRQDVRDNLEAMWQRFRPFCPDIHFLNEARHDFGSRTWEMYLACVLLDFGFDLKHTAGHGPDLCFELNGVRHWVEAIAPARGERDNEVPHIRIALS